MSICWWGSIIYGDTIPYTLAEMLFSEFCMILGKIYYSFIFAEVSSYVTSLH